MNLKGAIKSWGISVCFLGAIVTPWASDKAHADPADFYKGRTVELLIGYSAGGGYDMYARTLARHIGKHIPGNPEVVVKNVPGAGSLVLMNQLAHTLPKDGTVFGTVSRGVAFDPLFGNKQARFNPTEANWLGSLNNETSLCVAWHEADVKKWQDLRNTNLTVGSTGAGADTNLFPRVMSDLLDFKLTPIAGYPGGNDVLLAMERGEVGGRCGWSWSSAKSGRPDWFENEKVNILFQMSLKKHPDLPDVPLVTEIAETQKEMQVLRLLFARQVMGRPYVAPPGVPADRLKALRQAMAATVEDPEFLKDAANQDLEITYVDGEEIQEIVVEAYGYPEEVVNVIKNAE